MTLVDSNILLDLVSKDSNWWQLSLGQLEMLAQAGPLIINDIIYTETSIRYRTIEEVMGDISILPESLGGKIPDDNCTGWVADQLREQLKKSEIEVQGDCS